MKIEQLIEENQDLVSRIAQSFGKQRNDPDLLQCGLIGLWKAAKNWDGERAFRSFASVCIRNAMLDYLRKVKEWEQPMIPVDSPVVEGKEDLKHRIRCDFGTGTPESRILTGLLDGKAKAKIARELGLTVYTVDRIAKSSWKEWKQ